MMTLFPIHIIDFRRCRLIQNYYRQEKMMPMRRKKVQDEEIAKKLRRRPFFSRRKIRVTINKNWCLEGTNAREESCYRDII